MNRTGKILFALISVTTLLLAVMITLVLLQYFGKIDVKINGTEVFGLVPGLIVVGILFVFLLAFLISVCCMIQKREIPYMPLDSEDEKDITVLQQEQKQEEVVKPREEKAPTARKGQGVKVKEKGQGYIEGIAEKCIKHGILCHMMLRTSKPLLPESVILNLRFLESDQGKPCRPVLAKVLCGGEYVKVKGELIVLPKGISQKVMHSQEGSHEYHIMLLQDKSTEKTQKLSPGSLPGAGGLLQLSKDGISVFCEGLQILTIRAVKMGCYKVCSPSQCLLESTPADVAGERNLKTA